MTTSILMYLMKQVRTLFKNNYKDKAKVAEPNSLKPENMLLNNSK
jgi:hypothetical protein